MTGGERRQGSQEFIEKARKWTCHQFAISDAEANVPRLLRSVAEGIEDLGEIEILDVTFCLEVEGPQVEAKMTVYFAFPESAETES